jgi:hypothetical protein
VTWLKVTYLLAVAHRLPVLLLGIDDQYIGGDPASARPLGEDDRVAGVGIGAEDFRYEQADLDR